MIYRRFGRTELQLPVFSCGGMRYQQSWVRGTAVTVASQSNLEAPAPVLEPIVRRLDQAYRNAVGDEFARRWHERLPEWDQLPGRINVRRILWLRNLVLAYDLIDFAQERYAAMSPDDHWVPGAKAERIDDARLVAALSGSPFCQEIPRLLREAHAPLHNPSLVAAP